MKSTELMIGDWVTNRTNTINEKIDKEFLICLLSGKYEETEVFPLPLTTEILEKNGFRIGHHGTYNIWGFHIGNHYDGYFTPYIDVGYATRDLTYVHELQHALRLCGLTELADNFKV